MQYIPIKTRILKPPKDDLWAVLNDSLTELKEKDVVVISSKAVSIGEGRCVDKSEFDAEKYVSEMADVVIPRPNWPSPLTITNNIIVGGAGADKSNSDGYVTLLPSDPFASAKRIYQYLKDRFKLEDIGVIISDSRSEPCRYGAIGSAIAFWGFHPLQNHIGKKDLFGRKIRIERSNVADGITAGAVVVMGEVNECTPIIIARDVPKLEFVDADLREELFCPLEDDVFKVLYERFLS